jgi:acyl-CoA hydrolase
VILQAQVNFAARTSMEVGVRVLVEDPRTRGRVQTTRAYLTFVAVDEAGRPRPVDALAPETDEDRRRLADASRRRAERLRERKELDPAQG